MDALHVDKRDVACVLAVEALRRGEASMLGAAAGLVSELVAVTRSVARSCSSPSPRRC